MGWKIAATVTLCMALPTLAAEAVEPTPELLNNPFHRPVGPVTTPFPSATPAPQDTVTLSLRAILSSGDTSLANINGRILSVGELLDGYRLTHVGERGATLEKDGHQVTVVLDDEDQH